MTPDPSAEIRDLAIGVRAISCAFAFIICYFNAFLAFKIGTLAAVYSDMLGGKELPFLTRVVFIGQGGFMALSLAFPLGAVLAVWLISRHRTALGIVGGILIGAFLQMHFTWCALTAPLLNIFSGMTQQP